MKRIGSFFAGLLLGTMLFGGTTAYAAGVIADLINHQFFVDGKEVKMTAYVINGSNYVMLRDMSTGIASIAVSRWRVTSPIPARPPMLYRL